MKNSFKKKYAKFLESDYFPIIIALLLSLIIVIPLSIISGVYKDFNNILVESHGLLFDIVVFGILVQILTNKKAKKERILRYQENIDNYRELKTEEAKIIIISNVKKLVAENYRELWLNDCYLPNTSFRGYNFLKETLFINAELSNSNFTIDLHDCSFAFAKMPSCCFLHSKIEGCIFTKANLEKSRFERCNLHNSKFFHTDLQGVLFEGCDFQGVEFIESDLTGTHFFQVKNLTLEQLRSCKNLDKAILPEDLIS